MTRDRRPGTEDGSVLLLDIESIAAGGDGVARNDGLVVFTPRTAVGDRIEAKVTAKGRMARGAVVRIERPGADRVEPECAHYDGDHCGGCQLQHISVAAQLEAKRRIISDALRRIGKREVEPPEVRSGANAWRYRRKLTLALRRSGHGWIAGLHAFDNPARVFPLGDCTISDQRLMVVWHEVLAAQAHFPDAIQLRGAVRLLGATTTRAAFVLEGGRDWPAAEAFFNAIPSLAALWWAPENGSRRLLGDRREANEPGASFTQVNPEVAAKLEAFVVDAVMSYAPATVVDAYSGSGGVAVELAMRGARVIAIELDADASAWAASRLPQGSRAVTARVEDAIRNTLPADIVVLNPPRTGVDARVTAVLSKATPAPRAIVYVSCDPATLARDLARLPAWKIARLTAFDMFPQTAHVETVVELVPVAP
ncbi:MAG: class I SAM-dependent RNA methyltransferase [Gemmatimonadales bacterium]